MGIKIIQLWGLATLVFLPAIARLYRGSSYYPTLFESSVYLIVTIFFLKFTTLPSVLAPLKRRYNVFLTLMFIFFLMSQLLGTNWSSFPFQQWGMFCCPPKSYTVVFQEYKATLWSGKTALLKPVDLFPSLKYGRFSSKLGSHAKCITSSSAGISDREACLHQYSQTLLAVGQLYNSDQPDDPIRTIEVYQNAFALNDYTDDQSITRKLILSFQIN